MAKPSVVITAGLAGLVAVGIAVKHFSGSAADGPVVSPTKVEAVAKTQRGGWSARADGESSSATIGDTAPTSDHRPKPHAAGHTTHSQGDTGDVPGSARNPREERGSAETITGGERARGGFASLPRSGSTGSDPIRVGAVAPEASLPFDDPDRLGHDPTMRGGLGRSVGSAAPAPEVVAKANDNAKDPSTEGSDTPVLDLAFDNNNNNTDPKNAPTPIVENGVTFQTGDGAVFSANAQYAIPDAGHVNGDAGTISMRIQPQWDSTDEGNASLLQLRTENQWENRLQIFKNGAYLRFLLTPDTGIEANAGFRVDSWQPGQWHDVAVSWGQNADTGVNEASLYIDGRMVGKQNYDGTLQVNPNNPLFIGSDYAGGEPGANAKLSNIQVFNKLLPAENIPVFSSTK